MLEPDEVSAILRLEPHGRPSRDGLPCRSIDNQPSGEHPGSEGLTCALRNLMARPLGMGAASETPIAGGTPLPMPR